MTFSELFALVVTFGGTLASILGAFYTLASRRNGRETRSLIGHTQELIQSTHHETQELIKSTHRETQELIKKIHEENRALLDRMDQRANERHRERLKPD